MRTVDTFVADAQLKRELTDAAAQRLRLKTLHIIDWLQTFRRALGYAKRYPQRHPTRIEALETVVQATRSILREYGTLTLNFGSGHSRTGDGFELPLSQDDDVQGYTFYPFFRDGVVELQFKPGVTPQELDTVLEICGRDGRRAGDDVVTWVWSGRFKKIRMEVEPVIAPHIAVSLAAQERRDVVLAAYLTALRASGPFSGTADGRNGFTTQHIEGLVDQGVDPETARKRLFDTTPAVWRPPEPERVKQWRSLFHDLDDRRARVMAASRIASRVGEPIE